MIPKTHSSAVDGTKKYIFNCGGYKDPARFNETQKEYSNYLIRRLEKGWPDISKTVPTLLHIYPDAREAT